MRTLKYYLCEAAYHTTKVVPALLRQVSSKGYRESDMFPHVEKMCDSLEILDRYRGSSDPTDDEEPIFICAVSWRTGSTLLQRILMTDERLLIWGEPYAAMGLIPKMTRAIAAVRENWPHDHQYVDHVRAKIHSTAWIANLYPMPQDLHAALRSLLLKLFSQPAYERDFSRWGLKEVRLGASDACLVHWLFPRAKFLVLIRNPFDAYLSAKNRFFTRRTPENPIWHEWPHAPMDNVADFARHWNDNAISWSQLGSGFPYRILKFEDIINDVIDFREIEEWLDLKISENEALSCKLGSTEAQYRLSHVERRIIRHEAQESIKTYGYDK